MSHTRSFYSIIQYVPDSGRAEAANVGLVLFMPKEGRIEIRTSPTLERVRKFFAPGRSQLHRIQIAVEALKNRLFLGKNEFSDESEFARFVAARADLVRLTAPRLAMIGEPLEDLNSLYSELVGDAETLRQSVDLRNALPSRIAEVLGRLEVAHKVWRPGTIKVPKSRQRFDVDFAYQNGSLNYVRAEALAAHAKVESRLEKLGFNGKLIYEHSPEEQRKMLVVVSSDPSTKADVEERFETTLAEFHVRFVPYRKASEFAAEIEKTAH
jgi:hypothetical protein